MTTYRVMLRGEYPSSSEVRTTDSIVEARRIAIKKLIGKNATIAWIMKGNATFPTYILTTSAGIPAKNLMKYDLPSPFKFYEAGSWNDAKPVRKDGTLVRGY